MQHLRRLILSIKHEEISGEELELFLNSEADTLQAFFEVVSLRSIARGFVLFGSEIGGLSRELKEAEAHLEHQMLKLASTEQQVQKISGQYRELKEQLQATRSFSRLTSLRDSLPTISFSGASGQENSRAEQPRLQELVKQLQNDLITARRDEADARRKSAVADARVDELERQLEEAGQTFESEMLSFAKAQRDALDEAKAREEAIEEQLRHNSELMSAADAEQNLQVPRKIAMSSTRSRFRPWRLSWRR
jgi:chromosome segregation ATPase